MLMDPNEPDTLEPTLLEALPTKALEDDERDVVDFLVKVIESLNRDVILSRMRLMCDKDSLTVDEIQVPRKNICLISVRWWLVPCEL